jgi:hypothetical protein
MIGRKRGTKGVKGDNEREEEGDKGSIRTRNCTCRHVSTALQYRTSYCKMFNNGVTQPEAKSFNDC